MFIDKLYLIRHGETEWNKLRLLQGISDIPLNDSGIKQAESASNLIYNNFTKINFDTIIHSPLSRAKETAKIINAQLNLPMVEIAEFRETNCGEYEGKPFLDPKVWPKWVNGERIGEGFESFEDCKSRVKIGLEKIKIYKKPLIVAHGGTLFNICTVLGVENLPDIHFDNCVLYALENINNQWFIDEFLD